MTPRIERTIAAEARAVEEGHRAFTDGRRFRIVSDTTDHRYLVTVHAYAHGGVLFSCDHPIVRGFGATNAVTEMGALPCKHCAIVARRLEREGAVQFTDVGWVLTDLARLAVINHINEVTATAERLGRDADPFAGL